MPIVQRSQQTLIKRVIACQGSIQLVTALAALVRHQEQHSPATEFENYLVIYDLYAPSGQIDQFASFVQQMAEAILPWKAIVYLSPEQLDAIGNQLRTTPPHKLFAQVRQLVGTDEATEIYLSRNWQFGNQLLINAYASAQKICYGDGIGLYFSENSPAFFTPQVTTPSPKSLKQQIISFGSWLREKLKLKTVLYPLPFDVGYFALPHIMGESPPMPFFTLDKRYLLDLFQKLQGLAEPQDIARIQAAISPARLPGGSTSPSHPGKPVSILLTSNLSEAQRLSQSQELQAYRQFLIDQTIQANTVLIIKPHPRDSLSKIQALKHHLEDLFSEILILTEPHVFFLPFEILFLSAFLDDQLCLRNPVRVFAVSSACLSFKLLFGVPSVLGFGTKLTQELFDQTYVAGRLFHDRLLCDALDAIEPYNEMMTSV